MTPRRPPTLTPWEAAVAELTGSRLMTATEIAQHVEPNATVKAVEEAQRRAAKKLAPDDARGPRRVLIDHYRPKAA